MRLRAPSQRHRPVEWKRVVVTRGLRWRRKWRQALSSGSAAKRVSALSSPMIDDGGNDVFVHISAPLNARDFLVWQKVKRLLTKSKLIRGVVRAAQKTCGSS